MVLSKIKFDAPVRISAEISVLCALLDKTLLTTCKCDFIVTKHLLCLGKLFLFNAYSNTWIDRDDSIKCHARFLFLFKGRVNKHNTLKQ